MKDLLEYIIKSLTSKPELVSIVEETQPGMINFKTTISPEDFGVIIGKEGQTIKAIRKLLVVRALAENSNVQVNISLQEK